MRWNNNNKTTPKDSPTSSSSSGWVQAWSFWRHCCCRYGSYPLLLAPLITVACLFDIYSFFGCQFIVVDVGFTPSNLAWNHSSTVNLGLFHVEADNEISGGDGGGLGENINLWKECRPYSDAFEDQFVDGDRTWLVSRVMAYISGSTAIVAAVTIWLFVLTPLPACFFWPGVMMPACMIAFLASSSKFLFFDTSICHANLWYPSGVESVPRSAESCGLGKTSYYAIAASTSFFVSLVVICLKAPTKRVLLPDYGGVSAAAATAVYAEQLGSERSYVDDEEFELNAELSGLETGKNVNTAEESFEDEEHDPTYAGAGAQMSFAANSSGMMDSMSRDDLDPTLQHNESVMSMYVQDVSSFDCVEKPMLGDESRDDASPILGGDSSAAWREGSTSAALDESRYNPKKVAPSPTKASSSSSNAYHVRHTSMERLAKMEQIQQEAAGEADEIISKCVSDLEKQFAE